MDKVVAITAVISAIATVGGMWLGWLAKGREQAKEHRTEGGSAARMQTDMDYIKRGVDELRLEAKDQGRRFDELSERVTRVEESSKQAHKRLDGMEQRRGVGND